MTCLYILEISPLSVASFTDIISHSEGCCFVVVVVVVFNDFLCCAKAFKLLRTNFFVFIFVMPGV